MWVRHQLCITTIMLLAAAASPSVCHVPPLGMATYQIVIPTDGLAEDARYDFILEPGETVQIIDRTPGFQATIEPASFSIEGFAYETPDCDLTRRIQYRRAFAFAKPSHIFWRRDVKRDAIDGRKYTFFNPSEEELDATYDVEFCIVVTAPSPIPPPADPDVVFRRRLQQIPEPQEHMLTVVIHSAALITAGPSFSVFICGVLAPILISILS